MGTHHTYNTFKNQAEMAMVLASSPRNIELVDYHGRQLLMPKFDPRMLIRVPLNLPTARVEAKRDQPVIACIGKTWDIAEHAVRRMPVSLGRLTRHEEAAFARRVPLFAEHVLDLPIQFPGTDVRLPGELASLTPVLQRIFGAERQLNPNYRDSYAYLSFHQGMVEPGKLQRDMPPHLDGFQGARWTEKHPANHSYLVSTVLPTRFYPRSFQLEHLDLTRDDVYAELARQIDAEPDGEVWDTSDHELVLMDAYCAHVGTAATQPVFRTWMQLSFETRVFDRLGNTHNPHFNYDWKMVPRDPDPRIRIRTPARAS